MANNPIGNLCVKDLPLWGDREPCWPVLPLLGELWGIRVRWHLDPPPPVFITQVSLAAGRGWSTEGELPQVYLFGYRLDLTKVEYLEDPLPPGGHCLEFQLVEYHSSKLRRIHHLRQWHGPVYAQSRAHCESVMARDLKQAPSAGPSPRWKRSQAVWPIHAGTPMTFVGQSTLPDKKVTREHLSAGYTVFLFGWFSDEGNCFKLTMQDLGAQTAEEHYAEEASRMRRRKRGKAKGG